MSRSHVVCLKLKLQRDNKLMGTVSLPLSLIRFALEHGTVAENSMTF